ncbi:MAG: hypothetical protein WA140_12070 [Geobacteraceae bacterium]
MKTNCKQVVELQKGSPAHRGFIALLFAAIIFFVSSSVSFAGMGLLTDAELSEVTAQGFSSFTMVNGVAEADFTGISAATYTEIDSLKMGYWDNGAGIGWDQNWATVKLGDGVPANDLKFNGFYFKAVFDPATVNDPAARQLQSVTIGSKDVTGLLSADFQSLSRIGGVARDTSIGAKTYQFTNTDFSISIELTGAHKGIWINMGTAAQI